MIKSIFLLMTYLFTNVSFAANTCKGFAFFEGEGQGPEPVEIICPGKNKDSKQCAKSCVAVAQKKCPNGVKTFNGTYNFISEKTGMEADSFKGKCRK